MNQKQDKIKIVFFSSDSLTWPLIEHLCKQPNLYQVLLITKSEDNHKKQRKVVKNQLLESARLHNIQYNDITTINKDLISLLSDFCPDLIFVYSFGLIFPTQFIEQFGDITVNIHPSQLPKYRGSSPVQSAILAGDREIAVSLIKLVRQVDAGEIWRQYSLPLDSRSNYKMIMNEINQLLINNIDSFITDYLEKNIIPIHQDENLVTMTKKIQKEAGCLDWHDSAETIYNQWRAYYHWPEIYSYWFDQKIILKEIDIDSNNNNLAAIGQVYLKDNKVLVQCGNGSIILKELQLAGGKQLAVNAFINGHQNFINSKLTNLFSQ